MVELETCSQDEKRAALARATASRTFARSEQLRSFLRYVCEAEIHGTASALNEYSIGVEVLHRPAGYSPAEDSSVRTRAYELRQKLVKLYATELPEEPVQIVIPKGAYSPRFTRAVEVERPPIAPLSMAPVPYVETLIPENPARTFRQHRIPSALLAVALVSAVVGAALTLAFGTKNGRELDPVVAQAWEPFAKRNDAVLLIAATPLYLVLGPGTHGAFGTPIFPAPPESYPVFRQHRPLAPGDRLGMIFTNDALGVGSMNAVLLTSNALRGLGATPQVLPERPAMLSVLHGRDTVLFGAPVDSQVISELLEKVPLSVVYDEGVKEFVIRDRTSGEVIEPEKESSGDFKSVYGLVTVLNTRESEHGRLGMVIFSGITSVGTHGAAEYFTSPRALKALREVFAKDGVHGFPAAYQVVVKCKFENMLLVAADYQSHRILRKD